MPNNVAVVGQDSKIKSKPKVSTGSMPTSVVVCSPKKLHKPTLGGDVSLPTLGDVPPFCGMGSLAGSRVMDKPLQDLHGYCNEFAMGGVLFL